LEVEMTIDFSVQLIKLKLRQLIVECARVLDDDVVDLVIHQREGNVLDACSSLYFFIPISKFKNKYDNSLGGLHEI